MFLGWGNIQREKDIDKRHKSLFTDFGKLRECNEDDKKWPFRACLPM